MGYLSNEKDDKIKANIDKAIRIWTIDKDEIFERIQYNEDGSKKIIM